MKTSEALRKYLRGVAYFTERIERMTTCWYVDERLKIKWTDEERAKLLEALKHYEHAKKLWREVMSRRIGDAVVREEGP